jgi:hypothetical protein
LRIRQAATGRASNQRAIVKLVVGVVVLVLAGWGWSRYDRAANERALATVASELAGRHVGVECQGFFSELVDIRARAGDVPFPAGRAPDHTYLTRQVCRTLKRFRTSSSHPELACLLEIDWARWTPATDFASPCADSARGTAEAINTLTHESMHLRGFMDEAQTQCYAIQLDAWTVVRLGGTAAEGAAVANFVLALQPLMPTEYQSAACRHAGSLDLHPETAAFPTEAVPQLPPASLRGPALG